MRHFVLLAALATIAYGSQGVGPDSIRRYRDWHLVTSEPVDMTPALMLSCVGPAAWDLSPKNPHVKAVFRVWVNPIGKAAMQPVAEGSLAKDLPRFPTGTVIVKEKFACKPPDFSLNKRQVDTNAAPELLTAMIKREPGFDPKNGDWMYLVVDGAFRRSNARSVQSCQNCHRSRASRGYVFGNYGRLTR